MSERKREVKFFSITDYDKEAEYLSKMHQEGWKLLSITFFGVYNFEKCEPEDVVYQLDYNKEGVAHKEEYVQMFFDCGWEYLFDYCGYSYFRKAASQMVGEEEIFCDELSRLDMLRRVMRGRLTPLLVIFMAVIVPQILMWLVRFREESGWAEGVLLLLYVVLLALYMIIFITFAIKYYLLRKRIGRK